MSIAVGWIGQSNMTGFADHRQVAVPATAPELATVLCFQPDLFGFTDSVGALNPVSFSASVMDPPTSSYDYPPQAGWPNYFPVQYAFGPETYGGIAIAASVGAPIVAVKLAIPGSYLTKQPAGAAKSGDFASWWWKGGHDSWDTTLPRSSAPFVDTVIYSGTATATNTFPATLNVAGTPWTPGALVGAWVTIGASIGQVQSNTSNQLDVGLWIPNGLGSPPAPGAFTVARRSMSQASLAKAFTEGYLPAAAALNPGFDMRAVCISLGESDAIFENTAVLAKQNMLSLIWWVRNRIAAQGLSTLPAERIGIALSLIKDTVWWPQAKLVNQAYREIADADPYVRLIPVQDLAVGGLANDETVDAVHYSGPAMQVYGRRFGAAVIELMALSAGKARASHEYYGRHVTVRPLWNVGGTRIADLAAVNAAPAARRWPPIAYLPRDGAAGRQPVYLDANGSEVGVRPPGSILGYSLPGRVGGASPADLSLRERAQASLDRTVLRRQEAAGFLWRVGGRQEVFHEQSRTYLSGDQQHTLIASQAGVGRIRTVAPASGIDREWLCRGASGTFGLSAELRIDEKVGAQDELWMRHRMGWGSATQPQVAGAHVVHLPPSLRSQVDEVGARTRVIAMEIGADELAPLTGLTTSQVAHGGVSANGDAVIWSDVELEQFVEPNFRGLQGVFRVVHSATLPFLAGATSDTLELRLSAFLTSTFGKQFVFDPATNTETDLAWTLALNRFYEVVPGTRTTYNKDGSVNSSGASWFSTQSAVMGWSANGTNGDANDGLTVAIFQRLSGGGTRGQCTSMILGQRTEPPPGADAGFAAYDQRDCCSLTQVSRFSAGAYAAGTTFSSAMFVLVGTMAQVKAAAITLHQLPIDATWSN